MLHLPLTACAIELLLLVGLVVGPVPSRAQLMEAQWPTALGDAGGRRYSDLDQITRANVRQLKVKWIYRHGDFRSGWPESEVKARRSKRPRFWPTED